jgi:flagellar motor switch protein FliG
MEVSSETKEAAEKVRPRSISRSDQVPGLKKAAILLVFLGEKLGSEVFKSLEEEEVKVLSQAISDLGLIGEDTSDDVLNECYQELLSGRVKLKGDIDYVKNLTEAAFDPQMADEVLRCVSGKSMTTAEGLRTLKYSDPQLLSKLIQDEHPQTVAVILANLEPDHAAEVIRLLPEEVRCDIAMRLAQLDQVSQPVQNRVAEVIAAKLREGGQYDQGSHGGVAKTAEIFNRMDRTMSRGTLEAIENENPNLALSIRNLMFVFDDILLLSSTDMRKIIQRVDKKMLVQALKGTPEELRDYFYRNMSQRAADMLKEDMEALGPVRLKDAEVARQTIVALVRELDSQGEIDIRGSGGDQYVV